MCINTVTMSGNLTRDAQVKTLANGRYMLQLRLAQTMHRGTNPDGTPRTHTNYVTVTRFTGHDPSRQAQHLVKGAKVTVTGRLIIKTGQTPQGATTTYVDIEAAPDGIEFQPAHPTTAPTATAAPAGEDIGYYGEPDL